jgi:hypothetical protein
MSGLEVIVGLERMNINQCQRLAEKIGFDKATFDLCGPKGKLKAKWLDAYMGIFQIAGQEGFVMTRQFEFQPDVWCENLMVEEPSPNAAQSEPSPKEKS